MWPADWLGFSKALITYPAEFETAGLKCGCLCYKILRL